MGGRVVADLVGTTVARGRVVAGFVGATVVGGRVAGGWTVVRGTGVVGARVGMTDCVVGAATGGLVVAGGDAGVRTAAAKALPVPTPTRPRSRAAVADARLATLKRGSDPRSKPTIPMPESPRPPAMSSQGSSPMSSPISSRMTRILAHIGRVRNRPRTRWRSGWVGAAGPALCWLRRGRTTGRVSDPGVAGGGNAADLRLHGCSLGVWLVRRVR